MSASASRLTSSSQQPFSTADLRHCAMMLGVMEESFAAKSAFRCLGGKVTLAAEPWSHSGPRLCELSPISAFLTSLASDLMVPCQRRWSAPPRLISSTRHQCSYWSQALSTFPLSACLANRAGQQQFSDTRGGCCVYVRCSCQFAQTALCPGTSIKMGSQSCAAVSF